MSYLLTIFIFSPLLGILALSMISDEKRARVIGIITTLIPLVCSFIVYGAYISGTGFDTFAQKVDWIQFGKFDGQGDLFKIYFELGVDGLSFVLMMLTAVLAVLAAITAIKIKKNVKSFYILFLLLETGMLGVFAAQNLLLFFFFFELTLPAMFFLVGKWGKFASEKAAYSYLLYNGIGSAIMLLVFVIIFVITGTTNFHEAALALQAGQGPLGPISESLKMGLFIALFIALGIKLPIFPLHRWMVNVHVQAPPAVVMLHAGVLLKIGAYGMIRFGLGLFPAEFNYLAPLIAILGVINLLYGALIALVQKDLRSILAYSSISHMGIVLIGLGSMNVAGVKGALFQVVSHGLIAALLFFLVGILENRYNTSDITHLGGLAKQVPLFSGFLLAAGMASLGLPGMAGFVGEFLAFLGLFQAMPIVAAIGTLGIILTAVYMLRAVLTITFGQYELTTAGQDVKGYEFLPILVLMFFIIAIGVAPQILGGPLDSALQMVGR